MWLTAGREEFGVCSAWDLRLGGGGNREKGVMIFPCGTPTSDKRMTVVVAEDRLGSWGFLFGWAVARYWFSAVEALSFGAAFGMGDGWDPVGISRDWCV